MKVGMTQLLEGPHEKGNSMVEGQGKKVLKQICLSSLNTEHMN